MTCHSCRIECKRKGRDRKGSQRFQCRQCSKTFLEPQAKPLEGMYLLQSIGLFARLITRVRESELRREYHKRLWRFLKVHRRPGLILSYLFHMTMHYHAQSLAKRVATRDSQLVNSF